MAHRVGHSPPNKFGTYWIEHADFKFITVGNKERTRMYTSLGQSVHVSRVVVPKPLNLTQLDTKMIKLRSIDTLGDLHKKLFELRSTVENLGPFNEINNWPRAVPTGGVIILTIVMFCAFSGLCWWCLRRYCRKRSLRGKPVPPAFYEWNSPEFITWLKQGLLERKRSRSRRSTPDYGANEESVQIINSDEDILFQNPRVISYPNMARSVSAIVHNEPPEQERTSTPLNNAARRKVVSFSDSFDELEEGITPASSKSSLPSNIRNRIASQSTELNVLASKKEGEKQELPKQILSLHSLAYPLPDSYPLQVNNIHGGPRGVQGIDSADIGLGFSVGTEKIFRVSMLCDTGADASVIDRRLADRAGVHIAPLRKEDTYMLCDAQPFKLAGKIEGVLHIAGHTRSTFLVPHDPFPHNGYSIILGHDLLRRIGQMHIDYDRGKLTLIDQRTKAKYVFRLSSHRAVISTAGSDIMPLGGSLPPSSTHSQSNGVSSVPPSPLRDSLGVGKALPCRRTAYR
jgi:hypothetical protein